MSLPRTGKVIRLEEVGRRLSSGTRHGIATMNDRAHAHAILREIRDILAQRLTERILDAREELLDDAHGYTYAGEIDTIYEQLAVRLNHVNVMLSNLPAEEPQSHLGGNSESSAGHIEVGGRPATAYFQASTAEAASPADTLATPHETTALPAPITFELFLRQITCHEIEAAARSLAVLLAVEEGQGRRSATTFYAQFQESPEVLGKIGQLRRELHSGNINESLLLLWECFGLQGLEAIAVMQTLKARLLGHNEAT